MTSSVLPLPTAHMLRTNRVWALAFATTLLLPWMLALSRTGMELCSGIICLSFLWHSARSRDWAWTRTPFIRVCFIAWGWMLLVVTPLAYEPANSFSTAIGWIRFPVLFAALRYWVLPSRHALFALGVSLLILVVGVAVDTLWQYLTGISLTGNPRTEHLRLTGPFDTPKVGLLMGKLLPPTLALALLAVRSVRERRAWVAPLLVLIGVSVTLLLTGDISITLSTGLAIAITAVTLMVKLPHWRMPCLALMAAMFTAVITLYATQPWLQDRAQRGYDAITEYSESDYGVIAGAAWDLALEHGLHGIGMKNYRVMTEDLTREQVLVRALHPHNFYLEWWAEAGVPGLLLFLTMIGMLLREAWRHVRAAQGIESVLPAVALGMLAQHFFPFVGMQSFFANWPAMLLWFPLAVIFAGLTPSPSSRR